VYVKIYKTDDMLASREQVTESKHIPSLKENVSNLKENLLKVKKSLIEQVPLFKSLELCFQISFYFSSVGYYLTGSLSKLLYQRLLVDLVSLELGKVSAKICC